MASPRRNLAVTTDGETYNKLRRPDDYLTSTTPCLPPLPIQFDASSSKRKRGRDSAPGNKRSKMSSNYHGAFEDGDHSRGLGSIKDCGMRTMLPGLDEELPSDDPMGEAVAYLQSVRSEALLMPPLLIAPTGDGNDEIHDDRSSRGELSHDRRVLYDDGVWIAVADERHDTDSAMLWDGESSTLDPQQSCYASLLRRFLLLRKSLTEARTWFLKQNMTVRPMVANRAEQPDSKRAWLHTMQSCYPGMSQIYDMNEEAHFVALESCTLSLRQSTYISREQSSWIWILLALTGDLGTLNYERISRIRDLGLQAGRLSTRVQQDVVRPQYDNVTTGSHSSTNMVPESADGAYRRPHSTDPDVGTESRVDADAIDVRWESRSTGHGREVLEPGNHEQHHVASSDRSEAEMSKSDNEDNQTWEQARARLLAQLGDRLVQARCPSPEGRPTASQVQHRRASSQETHNDDQQTTSQDAHEDRSEQGLSEAEHTKVAIDMILTVVAECYGQRDLLPFRKAW